MSVLPLITSAWILSSAAAPGVSPGPCPAADALERERTSGVYTEATAGIHAAIVADNTGAAIDSAYALAKQSLCASGLQSIEGAVSLPAQLARVKDDLKLTGMRSNPDALDHLWARARNWLLAFFESNAMQKYAGASRVAYLVLVALALVVVMVRALRRKRNVSAAVAQGSTLDVSARRADALTHRQRAGEAVARREGRAAFAAMERAVLARVGERTSDAGLTANRTHDEILAALPPEVETRLRPVLEHIQLHWYGGGAPLAEAPGALERVDGFLHAMDALPGRAA